MKKEVSEMIYTAENNVCWIKVRDYGGRFRASTNNQDAYVQVSKLGFRDNRDDAQDDLDKLARLLHWNELGSEIIEF